METTSLIWKKAIKRMNQENSYIAKLTTEEFNKFDNEDFSDDFVWYIEEKNEYWIQLVNMNDLTLSPEDDSLLTKAYQRQNAEFLNQEYAQFQQHIDQNKIYKFEAGDSAIADALKEKFGVEYEILYEENEDGQIYMPTYFFNIVAYNRTKKINAIIENENC